MKKQNLLINLGLVFSLLFCLAFACNDSGEQQQRGATEDGETTQPALKDLPLDVRVIAASNRNLKQESAEGNFRLDLYYRLSVIQINIPPLRERGDDALILADFYIEKANQKRGGAKLKGLSKETAKIFKNYEWTGNVRELRNVIERASILEDGEMVTTEHLPADLVGNTSGITSSKVVVNLPPEGIPLEEVALQLAQQAFERANGNWRERRGCCTFHEINCGIV